MPKRPDTLILPSVKHLHECLDYFPDTGVIKWKKRRPRWHFVNEQVWKTWNTRFAGTTVGHLSHGYLTVCLDYKSYLTHRLIWKMMERVEPPITIDHKDGDRANNRWSNLRAANQTQQNCNAGLPKTNTSGFKGVQRNHLKWCARVRINGVVHHRYGFDTPEQAAVAYEVMARELHGEFFRA